MVSRKQGRFKTQKPCARWRDADCDEVADSAPGDPAMVFMFRMASILPMVRASCPLRPAAGLLLDVLAHDRFRKPQQWSSGSCKNARNERARTEQINDECYAFRQDCDLNLGRAGVTRLGGIRLDDFRFAFGGNRHRQTLSLLRAELAVSPVRLNTRLGMSSPLPISARARSRPATVT